MWLGCCYGQQGLRIMLHPAVTAPHPPQLLAVVRRWRKFNTDLPGLLDEWCAPWLAGG